MIKDSKLDVYDIAFLIMLFGIFIILFIWAINKYSLFILLKLGFFVNESFIVIIYRFLFLLVIFISFALIIMLPITLFIILKTIYKKNKLKFKRKYYREIIKEYSPGVLDYIENYEVDYDTLVATIMYLELNEYVTSNKKIKLTNKNIDENLDSNVLYVYELIKNNKIEKIDYIKFKNLILFDCFKHKLLIQHNPMNIVSIIWLIFLIIFWLFNINHIGMNNIFAQNFIVANIYLNIFKNLFITSIISILIFVQIVASIEFQTRWAFNRNYKSILLYTKLIGLKKFIEDYGNFSDQPEDSLILWKEYLIYSIIFNVNKKAVEEYSVLI